jgi:hypothetical protein
LPENERRNNTEEEMRKELNSETLSGLKSQQMARKGRIKSRIKNLWASNLFFH